MKRVGVAFGGGGTRGLAHVGVLRALHSHSQYLPAMVAGTSAGSIAAALYSGGLPQERIEEAARSFHWFRHVVRFSDTICNVVHGARGGLLSNAALGDMINALMGYRSFDDLEVDLVVVASDLEHQRRVLFTSRRVARRLDHDELQRFLPPPQDGKPGCETRVVGGFPDIGLAVRASCAVPGIFLPVEIEGMRLLDGGVVDQVPVDVVRAMGAELVIGVSLSLSFLPRRVHSAASATAAMIGILGIHQHRRSLELADIGFQLPGIERRSMLDPHQLDLIDLGEREMNRRLEEWERRAGRRLAPRRIRRPRRAAAPPRPGASRVSRTAPSSRPSSKPHPLARQDSAP